MKKYLCLFLSIILFSGVFTFSTLGEEAKDDVYEIAMVIDTEGGIDDKSFNQGSWEGVKKYSEEAKVNCQYFQSVDDSDAEYLNTIKLAIDSGAKVIVLPSFMFETALYQAQELHQDTKFIQIDGRPQAGDDITYKTADNCYSIIYAEEQAGFLAGYAAVKDGYRSLGFLGGIAVPAVVRFGYGFIQGADYAAKELKLAEGDVEMIYSYTGDFSATPENQNKAASWYQSGVEIVFGCGGAVGQSVFAAAEANDGKSIGVDVDQSEDSKSVITSAIKNLTGTVYDTLIAYSEGSFPGGIDATLGVESDGVALEMSTARFNTFSQEDYDKIYQEMKENKDNFVSDLLKDTDAKNASQIPTDIVKVTVVE
ncbi:MAG: BMP family ABC transporter substrate-binding protein [Clostridiales bacterium]|nr:BMP family ABC transporter substrate-binding protein [Clostridiales bacterium]